MRDEVMITGVGLISPLGDQVSRLLELVDAGELARRRAVFVPFPEGLDGPGEGAFVLRVPDPEPAQIPNLRRPFPDRMTLMAIQAADRALASAGVVSGAVDPARAGVVANTCYGPSTTVERYLRTLLTEGPGQVSAITFARAVSNAMVGELARRHRLRGPSTLVVSSAALGYAADVLSSGGADLMLCVGVDLLGDYTPWYHRRAGMLAGGLVLGEASAALVLERRDAARARGATAHARVLDYGTAFCPEAVQRVTGFTPESMRQAMEQALSLSKISPGDVDTLVAIDNGDRALGAAERAMAEELLPRGVRVLAPKRTIGECFGASEVLGAAIAAAALSAGDGRSRVSVVNAGQLGGALSSTVLAKVLA